MVSVSKCLAREGRANRSKQIGFASCLAVGGKERAEDEPSDAQGVEIGDILEWEASHFQGGKAGMAIAAFIL
jgi:hypothetical protein